MRLLIMSDILKMKTAVNRISGNAFTIMLTPESTKEKELLEKNQDAPQIEQYIHQAIEGHFGRKIKPASITPNDNYPHSVTVEMMAESGSV